MEEDAVHGKCAAWLRGFGHTYGRDPHAQEVWDSAIAAERERIASLWAGCYTDAEGHGRVDIGASIRAGALVDAA